MAIYVFIAEIIDKLLALVSVACLILTRMRIHILWELQNATPAYVNSVTSIKPLGQGFLTSAVIPNIELLFIPQRFTWSEYKSAELAQQLFTAV
jgi:hypothetical protein